MKKLLCALFTLSICTAQAANKAPDNKITATSDSNVYYVKAELGKSSFKAFSGSPDTDQFDYSNVKPKSKLTAGLAIGHRFNSKFRADINGQVRNVDYEFSGVSSTDNPAGSGTFLTSFTQSQKMKVYSLFANGYYDVLIKDKFNAYVTLGIGYAFGGVDSFENASKVPADNFSLAGQRTSDFAWNFGAGVTTMLRSNIDLDIMYRYVSLGRIGCLPGKTAGSAVLPVDPIPVFTTAQKLKAHQVTLGIIYKF